MIKGDYLRFVGRQGFTEIDYVLGGKGFLGNWREKNWREKIF